MHGINTRIFDNHGLSSKKSTIELTQQIHLLQPTIVHLHNIHGYYLNYKILFEYLKRSKIPVVWTFHDCWSITGHCAYFDFVNCEKWKVLCNACPLKSEYPASIVFDRSKKNYLLKSSVFNSLNNMAIVCTSNWLYEITKQSYLKDYPISTINTGIDPLIFKPLDRNILRKKLNIENKFVILGLASDWIERKGLKNFIEVAKRIDSDSIILIVGPHQKNISRLSHNIISLPFVNDIDSLCEIYSAADVFFNPTYEDNFPNTNLEAQACGTPVITFNSGGSLESLKPQTGFRVEKDDINGVLELLTIIKNSNRSSYLKSCVENIEQNYNYKKVYKKYLELYCKMILNTNLG